MDEHSGHNQPHGDMHESHGGVSYEEHAAGPQAEQAAHDRHAGHTVAMFRRRFWLSLALTLPAVAWSDMPQMWFGYSAPTFPGSRFVPAIFGTVVFLYGGMPFLKGAVRELRDRLPGMMTLIALAISVAFAFSLAVTLGAHGADLWWELATLVTIMLLGHWLEMRSISQAQGALRQLSKLLPDRALRVLPDGETEEVDVRLLDVGDLVLVRPGARVPADGEVVEGTSSVNESMITGESRPVDKDAGAKVIAGTVNGDGSLRVRVTGTGERTALAGIMRLVASAQASRSRAQDLADRAARFLTFAAIGAAALTAIGWSTAGASWTYTTERIVTVLVIACPHALGLAIPLVIAISTTLGARHGLLVRDRRALEDARLIDTVVFDKTGTLTLGEHRVVDVTPGEGVTPAEALRLAASVEHDSEHAVARAIALRAAEEQLDIPAARDFHALPGRGAEAVVGGRSLAVGGPVLLEQRRAEIPESLRTAAAQAADAGRATIYLLEGTDALAVFTVADAVRPESKEAVDALHAQGIQVAMITGDAEVVARSVANTLGIDRVLANVLPGDKAAEIGKLQAEGKHVAMVGDGVNDAPALATADVGIAIGAGTEVAVEAGGIVLVRSDPRDVPAIVSLSNATYRKMLQNLWWAAGYNVLAIPAAAGLFAGWGVVLTPAVGAVLMSASTLIVALNAQLLRGWEH